MLVACIDEAYLTATYASGCIIHNTLLKVRNKQRQFMRMKLPKNGLLWSTFVAGRSVKPVRD